MNEKSDDGPDGALGHARWSEILGGRLWGMAQIDVLDEVVLGDAAGATGNPTVTLEALLAPLRVTMNSSSRVTQQP